MHTLEPFFNWRHLYTAEEDERSPFFGREYSEFEFTNKVYNYLLHPQWDDFGSLTLYMKILFVDYEKNFVVMEFIGEWNDAINNDIMILKRDIIDELKLCGINKFILIGENVLNFHYSDDSYYEEWYEESEDSKGASGWIAFVNFQPHVLAEMKRARIDWYVHWGAELDALPWRTMQPLQLFEKTEELIRKRLG
ncbi:MAG: hypothetical protein HY064_13040 [Bacteroidetes bacterium]|nr:hypothetical protein [Bacteroidota bacterium]